MPLLHRRLLTSRLAFVLVAASVVVATAACSDDASDADSAALEATTTTTERATSTSTTTAPEELTRRAQARDDSIDVFADGTGIEPERQLVASDVTSAPGIPIVFLVIQETADRFEVYLPVRPNGSTGWVDKEDVEVAVVNHRVEVDLGAHRIRVFDGEQVVVDEPIGVGREDRPTPGGVYYLKELLQPPDPSGPYGPYAYGLSGFSTVLSSFNGGEGVIGIHGTNEPGKLGQDVSSGCIRVHNDVITRLVHDVGLPLGTPVDILS